MNCDVRELRWFGGIERQWIASRLTKPGSDFNRKLAGTPTAADGSIAVVSDFGEIIGWARSEPWVDGGHQWQTLEAFVAEPYRRRGVAAFAASGLIASAVLPRDEGIAVFHSSMLLLARRLGLLPVLFEHDGDRWCRRG